MSGKVYKLTSPDGYYYFGSTTLSLGHRLSLHKTKANLRPDMKIYKKLNAIGWDDVKISTIKEDDISKIKSIEDEYINGSLSDAMCLNQRRSYISREERLRRLTQYNHEIVKCPQSGQEMKRYMFYNNMKLGHQRENTAK